MYQIVKKKFLNPTVVQMVISAPMVAKKAQPGQFIILRVDEEGAYVVEGPLIDRLISGVNFEDDQSLGYFQRALRRYGIIDALEKAGIEEEDTVKMGEDIEFEFMY